MDNKEFAEITRGITASRIAELTAKSINTIQSYSVGRAPIPYEVAEFAVKLKNALDKIRLQTGTVNARNMKKITGGKLYNTRTADLLGSYYNGFSDSDFRYICEELYRTKNGAFFTAGSGGSMTKYEKCFGNSSGGSKDIFPLTEAEAREWLEQHGTPEEYEAAFGDPPEA